MQKIILILCVTIIFLSYTQVTRAAQAPAVFTYKLGDGSVSLLSEGQSERKSSLFVGASEYMVKKHTPSGVYSTAANAFLVRLSGQTILIDTGYGQKLFENMRLLGVTPEQVDAVLLTHMHGDHIGGLLSEGKKTFPKAKVFVAQQEYDYWTNKEIMKSLPEDKQKAFAKAEEVIEAYGTSIKKFIPAKLGTQTEALLPNITPYAAFGHTPGHTVYLIENKGESLLVWGDLTHSMAMQMPEPTVAMVYDVAPDEAVASRLAVLQYVVDKNIPVAGMHIPFPAMGTLKKAESGGFTFTPAVK